MMRYYAVMMNPSRHSKQRMVIKMKNFTKILCVVLALVVALSAAACSLTQQYAYQKDDIELPIGTYIYYLYSAYNEAQNLAQQSDLYDSETGKYDGKKSFLKMEITDEDGETAVAEDWINDKAAEKLENAVAICTKFNDLGCTVDQTELDQAKEYIKSSYWDQSLGEQLEGYGVSFDSFFLAEYEIAVAEKNAAFLAEYGAGGPSEVSTPDLTNYFTENYTAYKYFSVNLYDTETAEETDADAESSSTNVPFSEEKIAEYMEAFNGYVTTINDGGSFEDVVEKYMSDFDVAEDPSTSNVEIIDEDTTDELLKTIKDMKDGQVMTMEIGDDDTSKQLYLIYREPIEDEIDAYINNEEQSEQVLNSMKSEDFDKMLKDLAEDLGVTPSDACKSYQPSMFEDTKKKGS